MTTKPPPKDEGLLNLLNNVLKKSNVTNEEFESLVSSVEVMSKQLLDITKTVELLMVAVQNQNKAISDLYKVQEILLTTLTTTSSPAESTYFIDVNKTKNEKPN